MLKFAQFLFPLMITDAEEPNVHKFPTHKKQVY